VLITIEAQHEGGRSEIESAADGVMELLPALGGSAITGLLNRDSPGLTV
jgi:hypothetical protein